MNNGFYQATGAMVTQFNYLDVISNNLANMKDAGFKQDDVVISDFERIYQEKRDILPIADHTKKAAKFLNRSIDRVPQISENWTNFTHGAIKKTGNSLDFALKREDAFFKVLTPNGVRLTQNGIFTIASNGDIVTKEGYPLLPDTYAADRNARFNVAQNAHVSVDYAGNVKADGEELGKMDIVTSKNLKMLQKEGSSLFKYKDEDILPLNEDQDVVAQGFLEMSNVNPVRQMTRLIATQRLVEMYQKVMTTHMDDLNEQAIGKIATSS